MAKITKLDKMWLDYYLNQEVGLCSLCGNSGVVDTRKTAVSQAGVSAGRLNWCICPNGRTLRKQTKGELPGGESNQ